MGEEYKWMTGGKCRQHSLLLSLSFFDQVIHPIGIE